MSRKPQARKLQRVPETDRIDISASPITVKSVKKAVSDIHKGKPCPLRLKDDDDVKACFMCGESDTPLLKTFFWHFGTEQDPPVFRAWYSCFETDSNCAHMALSAIRGCVSTAQKMGANYDYYSPRACQEKGCKNHVLLNEYYDGYHSCKTCRGPTPPASPVTLVSYSTIEEREQGGSSQSKECKDDEEDDLYDPLLTLDENNNQTPPTQRV
jgi:hypothetical protein